MPAKSDESPAVTPNDAEMEWLLCLAAELQSRQHETENSTTEPQAPPEPSRMSGRAHSTIRLLTLNLARTLE